MSLLHAIWDTTVEDKEVLEQEFLAWLREHGYPEGSLFRGPSFLLKLRGKSRDAFRRHFRRAPIAQPLPCYADLAILDLETNQYAALVEFRARLDEDDEKRLATVFQAVLELEQLPTPPAIYLVVSDANSGFKIYQMQKGGYWSELPATQFPGYNALIGNFADARVTREESLRRRSLDRFTYACRALAAIIAALTISSIIILGPLNTIHILLLIIAALLFLGPEALGYRTGAKHRPRLLRFR